MIKTAQRFGPCADLLFDLAEAVKLAESAINATKRPKRWIGQELPDGRIGDAWEDPGPPRVQVAAPLWCDEDISPARSVNTGRTLLHLSGAMRTSSASPRPASAPSCCCTSQVR